jgi:hypothetical protein
MLSFVKQFEMESVIHRMKKVISISFTILVLTAMFHFSVATHYCAENIAATKISLSGKLASCGMEDGDKDLPHTGLHFGSHCCDNVIVFYGIYSNYFPSFSSVPESYQNHFQVFSIPADLTLHSLISEKSTYTSPSPPDEFMSNSVDLSNICVFRI